MGKAIFLVVVAMLVIVVGLAVLVAHLRQTAHVRRRAEGDRQAIARAKWLQQRPTDQERRLAEASLADAYALGQLTLAEHDARVAAVLAATTNAEVQHQLRDLGDLDRR